VGEFRLRFAVSPLALSQILLRLLALGQIEHEGDVLVSASAEGRRADKHGHAGCSDAAKLGEITASSSPITSPANICSGRARLGRAARRVSVLLIPTFSWVPSQTLLLDNALNSAGAHGTICTGSGQP
jgi:hypothetical protein